MSQETKNDDNVASSQNKVAVKVPSIEEMLAAGVHFGHQTKRWNPKMQDLIYTSKNKIHIIDIYQTQEFLKKALEVLVEAASNGDVVFVGTKRQASEIVQASAISAGAHFVNKRWAGGLLTNLKKVRESFYRLKELEKGFEEGVTDRTKYEVSLMKKEWGKLHRLYGGIKNMTNKPTALVVVDAKFESGAVKEARSMGIPVIAMLDTNTDPSAVDYPIPSNDDAISSITLVLNSIVNAINLGNKGNGVKHLIKDYSKVEVVINKTKSEEDTNAELKASAPAGSNIGLKKVKVLKKSQPKNSKLIKGKVVSKGILERVQDAKRK